METSTFSTGQNEIERYKQKHVETAVAIGEYAAADPDREDTTSMQRRDFLKRSVALALAAELVTTWVKMLEVQQKHFTKTPLMTNTQPDYSRVSNSEVLDLTIRRHYRIRGDTIFTEHEQIETLCNRPPWIAAALEQIPAKSPDSFPLEEGLSPAENMIAHVIDVGANYWSLWNFHSITAKNLLSYYQAFPKSFDQINRRMGYRVRPSMVLSYDDGGHLGVIVALANDGIVGVPGVLRVTVESDDGKILTSGCLNPGYPLPGKLRQAAICAAQRNKIFRFETQSGDGRERYALPVQWACRQKLNEDGFLTLRSNLHYGL